MEAVHCVLSVCVLRALCLYRQLLFCYPNKQEFTSLLSFLSHCLVSLATVSDKLRGGLTPSREPILSHPKFVSLWVMWQLFPWQPGWRTVWISLWSGEKYHTCQLATLKSGRVGRHAMALYADVICCYHIRSSKTRTSRILTTIKQERKTLNWIKLFIWIGCLCGINWKRKPKILNQEAKWRLFFFFLKYHKEQVKRCPKISERIIFPLLPNSINHQQQSHQTDYILRAGGLKALKVLWSMISIWPL